MQISNFLAILPIMLVRNEIDARQYRIKELLQNWEET